MTQAIGIRIPEEILKKIEELSEEEMEDRSTTIRKLLKKGYENVMKDKAAESYKAGKITLSEAANRAGTTLWEMEKYLVEQGYKSSYSTRDLKEEVKKITG